MEEKHAPKKGLVLLNSEHFLTFSDIKVMRAFFKWF